MERYDYYQAVCDDIRAWLDEHESFLSMYADENGRWLTRDNYDQVFNEIYDEVVMDDSVTGNASGSYTFNSWCAEENICHNLDLLRDISDLCGCNYLDDGAEAADVAIRFYMVDECLRDILSDILDDEEE